jgi:hypothetical protein
VEVTTLNSATVSTDVNVFIAPPPMMISALLAPSMLKL